jgi:16S rRNA (guanine527-N7)-methyltransferase
MRSLQTSARAFHLELDAGQLEAFETYYRELIDWNTRVNLTAISEREQVIVKHFLDSLSVALVLRPVAPASLVDIGAGAGLPGIPLKIAFPALQLTLLDATRKKVEFLNHIIARLNLSDTRAVQARAEDWGKDPAHREQYEYAIARAVADLPVLLEYALPLVRVGGAFIAQKGIAVEPEIERAEPALHLLGGHVREVVPVQLPGLEPRHLVVVDKIAPTPAAYPRRAGVPEKKPLRE